MFTVEPVELPLHTHTHTHMHPAAQQCQSSVTAEQKSKSDDYAERKHIYVTFMPHSQHNNSIKRIHSASHVHTVTYF